MRKLPSHSRKAAAKKHLPVKSHAADFQTVFEMIESARGRTFQAVNTELIDLYWHVGAFISGKIAAAGWGRNTVGQLSAYIRARRPGISGFSASNLWRMRQFQETYTAQPKLAALLRELSWTQNLIIMARAKRCEEREFYLRLCAREKWPTRELERQVAGALFERTVLSPPKLAPPVRELHPAAESLFKDTYLLDFLDLPNSHSKADLQRGLVENLKKFLIELGRDFAFVGEQYLLQVGGRDFRLDLLFFHRQLQCLVAFDLKIDEFQPEYLGKMEFYLEALDRDIRKSHERPSIGVLLCATKDLEVVEYSLARSLSPALIAEYQTALPDKALLQRKLHEFYQLAAPANKPAVPDKPPRQLRQPAARRRKPR
jgi:predicted nuclease of restriction endonuclease-like (RecB) superfamily